jgi:hypothetical protein|tara:strand:- start:53 stop:352 length:300 start_codon:yes stop_codon:yes gene_type:complete
MPLNTTEAQEIADLFTSITVCNMMLDKSESCSLEWYLHRERAARATIELADTYGIELPCLEEHRKDVRRFTLKVEQMLEQKGMNKREDNLINADLEVSQ